MVPIAAATFIIVASAVVAVPTQAADPNQGLNNIHARLTKALEIEKNCPEPTQDKAGKFIPCIRKLSAAGNFHATFLLARAYAGDEEWADFFPGLKVNQSESIRLTILAIRQGSSDALDAIPPQPYKWQIGMSGAQVRSSVAGEPQRVIQNETESAYLESWIYPSAILLFEGSPISAKHVVLRSITAQK